VFFGWLCYGDRFLTALVLWLLLPYQHIRAPLVGCSDILHRSSLLVWAGYFQVLFLAQVVLSLSGQQTLEVFSWMILMSRLR
jgi:hypothetical protein